jgi:uncharacterized protein with GYD domain
MAKYMFTANYTHAGLQGLLKEGGTGRTKAVEAAAASVGGKVEAIYWAFGAYDVIVLVDLPDNAAASALSLNITAAGGASVSTTVLLTAAEVDAATKMHPSYRAPGG